jgi:hypothetical protein
MKNLKTLGIAGGLIAAALVGGTLINAVLAAPSGTSAANGVAATTVDAAKYCDLWQKTFAAKLNVSVDAAVAAAKAATIATIDAAVTAGDLTPAQATALKAKIAAADGNMCRFLGHPFRGIGPGPKARFGGDLLNAAAGALGMQPDALIQALRGGDSLQKITTDKGKNYSDVSKAVHDAAKTDLDKAVATGLAQARADQMLANLDKALAAGNFPGHGPGSGHFGFPGLRHPDAGTSPAAAPAA